jgi:hypothetical protein
MVVLSAAVLTSGKTLVARQFVEMTRLRVEGLMSAFSKLVDSGRDHTFFETESVRYIYQPMEALHLVLITNKASNILEDLETLRLLAKVVQDCCQIQVNEEFVLKHAFEIVFAFDEVISFGHRESVTLAQIKTYTEMDSHEEKLHQMMEQSKINEAREHAKKRQLELAKQRALQPKDSAISMTGFGSSSGGGDSTPSGLGGFKDSGPSGMGGGGGGGGMMPESVPSAAPASYDLGTPTIKSSMPSKGLQLGKKRPENDMLRALGLPEAPSPGDSKKAAESQVAPQEAAPVNPLLDPVQVEITENITAELEVEGGLEGDVVCNGTFQVTVLDGTKADLVCFKLAPQDQTFKYKVHPNLNKASHANNILEVRDASKAFRANTPVPLVKYQFKTSDDGFLPVSLTCWPTPSADGTQVVVELELKDTDVTLEDVHICFTALPQSRPAISNADPGEAAYDAGAQQVHWQIPVLDKSEATGTLDFSAAADIDSLLPFTFTAVRRGQTKCNMDILECYHQASKDALSYSCSKSSVYSLKIGG